jgi:hypothetical protein
LSALAVWAFAALPTWAARRKIPTSEPEMRAATEDSCKAPGITESDDYWVMFPVARVGAVAGDTVAVKAGRSAVADYRLKTWERRKGGNRIVGSVHGGTYTLAYSLGRLEAAAPSCSDKWF